MEEAESVCVCARVCWRREGECVGVGVREIVSNIVCSGSRKQFKTWKDKSCEVLPTALRLSA